MNSTLARRFALTLATAGIAVLGSVAIAPAASAAPVQGQDGSFEIVVGPGKGNGPDAFIMTEHGRKPVFFCEADQPANRADTCVPGIEDGGTRF